MSTASGSRLLDLLGIDLPIIQAPMAGATTPDMVIAVSEAGGLGSLPSALYTEVDLRAAMDRVRAGTRRPINLNFFCHANPADDAARQAAWLTRLAGYYAEAGLDPNMPKAPSGRSPFDAAACAVVEAYRPEVVSFHFGLPPAPLLDRVKRAGAKVLASATTVAEARWLADRGVDAVIAMGSEAGGHRGSFLTEDMSEQVGTFVLVPQIVDAVSVPVIAAGGIADRRGVAAAFALGAAAVQVGTAYLFTPEAKISEVYRKSTRPTGPRRSPICSPAGAGHRQSPDGGSRPAVRSRPRVSDSRRRSGAAAQCCRVREAGAHARRRPGYGTAARGPG